MISFSEIIAALMEDGEWEVPKEERELILEDLAWTLLDL